MFEINKEKMQEKKTEAMAREMFANMMIESILTSESAPEHIKLCVRTLAKARDLEKAVHDEIIHKYCTPGNEANVETLKKVVEYLEMVEIGIKQFVETTPFVANTEEE